MEGRGAVTARGTNWIAAAVAVTVVLLLPLGFFGFSYRFLAGSLEAEGEIVSSMVTRVINSNPEMWRYEYHHIEQLLTRRELNGFKESGRILDLDGKIIAEHVNALPRPLITRDYVLKDAGVPVARLELQRSLAPLLLPTALSSILGVLAGGIVFFTLRVLSLRAVKRAQRSLREANDFLRTIMESSTNAILAVGLEGSIIHGNGRGAEISGYAMDELQGMPFASLFTDAERKQLAEKVRMVVAKRQSLSQVEADLVRKNGEVVQVTWGAAPLIREGQAVGLVWTAEDISERKRAEKEIHQLAYHDILTSLPNRVLLEDRLQQAISQAHRDGEQVAVMFLDLDRFKSINDSLGHAVGDRLLQEVSVRLRHCLRESDTVARLGGDEFVAVLSGLPSREDVVAVAEKVRDSVARPMLLNRQEVFTSASIGIALYPQDGREVETLLKHADLAMYQAKGQGRNHFQFFCKEMNARVQERVMIEASLRGALERDELRLFYQPQIDLETGEVRGVEALLRWEHPQMGLLGPERFLALAEETGLILPIGEWVLRTAGRQCKAWRENGWETLRMAVNLSAIQVRQADLIEMIDGVLAEYEIDPKMLEIELTESTLLANAESTLALLNKMKAKGIGLAVDDFGTGYSSLSYLKHFPIDRLKIDRSFVLDIAKSRSDAALAEAIVAIANSMDLQVTAEGVESREQMEFLAHCGCDEIQGHYVSVPLTAEALHGFLCGLSPRQGGAKEARYGLH